MRPRSPLKRRDKARRVRPGPRDEPANRQWLNILLPTIPLVLLVLRLWLLSRGDLKTMLFLIQYVNPLGLVTALIVTLVWALPAAILTVRTLSVLLLVSDPRSGSRLARETDRMPGWVVVLALLLAAFMWQLRFLPLLLMVTLMILALDARRRYHRYSVMWNLLCVAIPAGAAVACYALLIPGIVRAFLVGEVANGLLLAVPPAMAVLLAGPVPLWAARAVTRGTAYGVAVFGPLLVAVMFSGAPILPTVAVELKDAPVCRQLHREPLPGQSTCVVLGQIITVDDRVVSLLRTNGSVVFIPNRAQKSQVLCDTDDEIPTSQVDVRGWYLEYRVLDLFIRRESVGELDPRCEGRPLPRESAQPRQRPDPSDDPVPSDGADDPVPSDGAASGD